MRRLRDLGLSVGELPTGPLNAIIDVEGVRVGHARGAVGGITVVVPFPDIPRRYYAGRWSLDGGDDTTALAMLEDFGALSTPIALAPALAVDGSAPKVTPPLWPRVMVRPPGFCAVSSRCRGRTSGDHWTGQS